MQGGLARYINHSCEPNCYTKTVRVDGTPHIVIYSKRNIRPGEELLYDYMVIPSISVVFGIEAWPGMCPTYWHGGHGTKLDAPMQLSWEEGAEDVPCLCGAAACRGTL